MKDDVTVIIPTIPPRQAYLEGAHLSCLRQNHKPAGVITVTDVDGKGAAQTRNTGLACVATKWVAFLDDDDVMYASHLQVLMTLAIERENDGNPVDLVYPWFDVENGTDPLATMVDGQLRTPFGVPFGPEQREHLYRSNFIPVTTLVRTELAQAVGGFPEQTDTMHEDWGFLIRLLDAGAEFAHAPHRTWMWRHHLSNTSGRPWKQFVQ